jgi:hypothetical protein
VIGKQPTLPVFDHGWGYNVQAQVVILMTTTHSAMDLG